MPAHRLESGRRDPERTAASSRRPRHSPRVLQEPIAPGSMRLVTAGGGRHQRVEIGPPTETRPTARRVPGHTPWAADGSAADGSAAEPGPRAPQPRQDHGRGSQLRSPRRVGVDRQSRRSLVVGGALVIAILGGAGAVAWAGKPADPQPVVSVDPGNGAGRVEGSGSPADDESPLDSAPAGPIDESPLDSAPAAPGEESPQPAGNQADSATAPAVGSAQPPAADFPAPTEPAPATVSPLGPGDVGFGWPSTAFGSIEIGPGT